MTNDVPLKRVVSYNDDLLAESTDKELLIRYVEISDVSERDGIMGAQNVEFGSAPSRARRILRRDDVVVSTVRTYLRSVAAVGPEYDGTIASTGFAVLRARGINERFLKYAILDRSFMDQVVARSTGVSYPAINASDLVRIRIPVPSLADQRTIADYLDREAAQIDAFIAKNEELISLLTERRVSVISQAVSRGPDKSTPVVTSDLSWTKTVAAGWNVSNIRRHALMRTGHTPSRQNSEYWIDCTIPWFTLSDVWQLRQGNRFLRATNEKISSVGLRESSAELLPPGTVVLSRTASVGFTGIMDAPMATSQDFWNWIPNPTLSSEYLRYQFIAMRPEFDRLMVGSTHRTIYQGDAAALQIVVPPLENQNQIVEYLDFETAKWEEAIATANRAIDLARERRAALISAAVTGKIDVSKEADAA